MRGLLEQEVDDGDEVKAGEGAGISLVVLHQAAKAGRPGKGPLDHPASPQQHEATLGVRQINHPQLDAMCFCSVSGLRAGIALVDMGQANALAGRDLHGPARPTTSTRSSVLVGVTCSASRWFTMSTARCTLGPFLRLTPSWPALASLRRGPQRAADPGAISHQGAWGGAGGATGAAGRRPARAPLPRRPRTAGRRRSRQRAI